MKLAVSIFIISFLFAGQGAFAQADAHPEAHAEVEVVVNQFLDAISQKDTTAFREVMLPEGAAIALFNGENGPGYGWRNVNRDIEMLGGGQSSLLERAWEPEIKIDGLLASVWTRYDFHVDGVFSHCGTDAFHIIKTKDGWKIASIIYTIESDAAKCPESPLGEPQF
ncbi:MAG: hypothetical protein AB8G77_23515 [Rhodothermales bacterium]